MGKSPTWLLEHSRNVYSQFGEDGILEKIFELLPKSDPWCVEFGAWDGQRMSNTCRLIESCSYSAVLIEGSKVRAAELKARYHGNPRIHPVNTFVGYSASDNLDAILEATPIPKEFDLLSIDIDGNDYHVWNATTAYRPKVVIVEFNPTVPTDADFVQVASPDISQGCGLRPLVTLGKEKGYELVCVTMCNAIFVRSEFFSRFGITDNRPETLRTDLSAVTWIFSGFDGSIILHGHQKLPWHSLSIRASQVQQMPQVFRHYPHSFGRLRKTAFLAYRKLWNTLSRIEQQ